jgi:hypothetical protein
MKLLNIPQLLEEVNELPDIGVPEEDSAKMEKMFHLIDLIGEDYICPEILLVPEADWDELLEFISALGSRVDEKSDPFAIRLQNLSLTKRLEIGFMQARTLPPSSMMDDFV